MATSINYSIGVQTTQAQQALNQLQSKLQTTNDMFGKLRNAFAGIAIGNFIANSIKAAAALDDIADASGIALQSIIGFSKAVQVAGGSVEGANTGIARFANYLQDAAEGNKKAVDSFLTLGFTMSELRSMSDEEILKKTIKGLGEMEAGSARTALGMSIFGKSFASVDFNKVNGGLDDYIAKSKDAALAVKAAADAEEKFGIAVSKVKDTILIAIQPITDFIAAIDPAKIESLAKTLTNLAIAFLAFKGLRIVLTMVAEIAVAATKSEGALLAMGRALGMGEGIRGAKQGLGIVKREWSELGSAADRALNPGKFVGPDKGFKMLGNSIAMMAKGFVRMIPFIGQVISGIMILDGALELLTGRDLGGWFDRAAEGLENLVARNFPKVAAMINGIGEALGMAPSPAEAKKKEEAKAKVVEETKKKDERKFEDPNAKEIQGLQKLIQEYQRANAEANKKFNLETENIGLSEEAKMKAEQRLQAESNYLQEINKLTDLYQEKSQSGSKTDLAMLPQIQKAIADVTAEYQRQLPVLDASVEKRINGIKVDNLAKFSKDSLFDAEKRLRDIQDEIATSTLSAIEKKYHDIDKAATEAGLSAIKAAEDMLKTKLPPEEAQKYMDAAKARAEQEKALAAQAYDNSRKFQTGWKNAFQSYVDDATNAAQQAQRIFQTMTQSMEDMLMTFFKTGKFEWKNYVQSIIDTLMRSQIQQLIAKTFSMGGVGGGSSASGGLLGGIGKLLGFANGGVIPNNNPVIVGERGPELLSGAGGRTVTPNNQLGSSVTYNINAVDAMSFKQMLAQDPTFLHAVAEQGRRTLPGAR
jgi:hypothetical protein